MKILLAITLTFLLGVCTEKHAESTSSSRSPGPITLVIHSGAGTITRENMSSEREILYHAKLREALDSGYAVLETGGKSLEAVIAAIKVMEDSPFQRG